MVLCVLKSKEINYGCWKNLVLILRTAIFGHFIFWRKELPLFGVLNLCGCINLEWRSLMGNLVLG